MMPVIAISRIGLALSSLLLVLSMSACTENGSTVDVAPNGDASITFTPPNFLNTRAIVDNNLDLVVKVNNVEITPMRRQGNIWTGSTTVAKNDSVDLIVEWSEVLPDSSKMLLARAIAREESVTKGITFLVSSDEGSYITTGEAGGEFDIDGDSVSNLEERKQEFNPLNAEVSTNDVIPDVQIYAYRGVTAIDGRRQEPSDNNYWDFATYTDNKRQKLSVSNMIRDDSVDIQEDPKPEYQWAAIHDEEFLTIFVWGKARNGSTILVNGDSGNNYFDDDSVEIFWDGDLSQSREGYDTKDDMLINIPLVTGVAPNYKENKSSDSEKRIYRGKSVQNEFIFDVQNSEIVEFATCQCGGAERSTWEIRINLEAAKIPIGKTFGFEVQINRDDDGGERDSKWAWAKPTRGPNETSDASDITWRYPFYMGKARLFPFPE